MYTNDILTEKNNLQKKLNDIVAGLERGQYSFSPPQRERFLSALSRAVAHAGELSFSGGHSGIEPLLLEMGASLQAVFRQGDDAASEAILKAVVESIDYLNRTDDAWTALPERERATRQYKAIDRMNLLVTMQSSLLTVRMQVRELEASQIELERKQREAADRMEEDQLTLPALKREIAVFRDHREIPGPSFLAYVRHVNDFTRAVNLSRRNAIVLERQHEVLSQLESVLYSLNMMIFGTPELLGNVDLARLEMTVEEFKKDLTDAEEQSSRLESISESVGTTIEELGTEAARKYQSKIAKGQALLAKYRGQR